jgi:hypothetical protein
VFEGHHAAAAAEGAGHECALRLDCLDSVLAARMPADEWRRVKAFRERPTFLDALETYAALIPPYFSNRLLLNKVVTEGRRFEMLVYLLYLHHTGDSRDPLSGLTAANFKRICAAQKVASPGRALAILGIMRIAGYLRRDRAGADSRVVRLAPTADFLDIVEGWNLAMLRIVDAAAPGARLAEAHARYPGLGVSMRTRAARALLAGWHLLEAYPEARRFIDRDGGWMLLLHCVDASLRAGARRVIAPVTVDLAAFGRRFGVSRSHLRRLLESAYGDGLLAAPPRNGSHILLARELVASFLTCMASELSFCLGIAEAARDEILDARAPAN